MSHLLGQRAVVVGVGIGRLSMAGALAKYFEQVEKLARVLSHKRLSGCADAALALAFEPAIVWLQARFLLCEPLHTSLQVSELSFSRSMAGADLRTAGSATLLI